MQSMVRTVVMVIASLSLISLAVHGAQEDALLGIWNSEDNKARIEIFRCSSGYCGRIVKLGEPEYPPDDKQGMGGKPRVDRENPDPGLRSRPLLGLQFMHGFRYAGENTWEAGTIYDPESGKTYKSRISLETPRRLKIRGYIGIPIFGRSTVWTR